jgi:hypothetical protein
VPESPHATTEEVSTDLPEMDNPELVGGKGQERERRAPRM